MAPLRPPFETVLRGFDRQQVIDHIGALETRIAMIGADRDAARGLVAEFKARLATIEADRDGAQRRCADLTKQLEQLRREAAEATAQVDDLQRSPLTAAGARIQRMLQLAVEEATELRTSTEQETTSLRESTRAQADQLQRETTQQCQRLEAESGRRRQAEEAESAGRCRQAELDSERRRVAAEQQSEHDIASRRAETEDWVRDYQTRGVAALHLILRMAGQRLARRVVEVERQVTALTGLRGEMTDQVSAVHRLLVEAVGLVDQPTTGEDTESLHDPPGPNG
ncbi:MAG TPA: hypothetical protein VIY28_06550 [Pseudonocardiaceae bacterium]